MPSFISSIAMLFFYKGDTRIEEVVPPLQTASSSTARPNSSPRTSTPTVSPDGTTTASPSASPNSSHTTSTPTASPDGTTTESPSASPNSSHTTSTSSASVAAVVIVVVVG